jgi:PAS domain S-box-containing protein
VYWSEELFRIWGFDPQRGLPTRDQAVQRIHPEDLDKYWQFWQSVMRPNQEKVDLGLEFRIVLPDGTAKHLYGVAHPVLNANGELVEVVGTTMDITERKRAEEALRLYSAYNRSLIEASVDPLVTIGPDGKITDVNAATELATGCSRGELIGTDFCDYFTEPGSAHVGYERAFREGVVRDYPLELQHRDGRVMSVLYNASVYRDQSDQVIGIFAAARDITERKRAEETLRRTEAYLAEAQRLSHTGSWAFDVAKGKYIYVSEECSRIFELDAQEDFPAREAVSRLIHAEDWDSVNQSFDKSVREKVDTLSEFRIVLPSGTTKHVQAIRHPVLNDAGDVVQVVGTVVDITERKAAEAALRESETRFRTFVDHAGDAFFMLDFADGTIVDLNQSACDSLGYTRGELIGMTPLAFDVNLDRATLESVAEQTATGEPVLFDRHSHRRKDGSLFPVEVHASVFWHGGRRFLLNVARDISDRVRADEERERLRQLEADLAHINRVSMMGELAASIAHEVNQPLSGIASNANASLRFLAGDSPNLEEARAALRDIVRDGKRAGEIIARIRALTKRTAAAREKLDLNETIREVLALVGDEARRSSVIVRTQFADDLSPVAGDRVQLQQVVLNLVMNAIEAMSGICERPRELLITTRNIDADHVQVTVEDSGIGLGPTTMDKIFDSFYTTKPGGMGMGLSIGRSILQAHGGQLWATAKDSPGTMFHFTVPKYHEEEAHAAATGT